MVDHQSVNSNLLQRYPLFGILTIFSFCAPGVSMVSFFGSSARFNRVLKNQNVRVLKFLTICRIFFEGASKNHPISCDYFLATIKQPPPYFISSFASTTRRVFSSFTRNLIPPCFLGSFPNCQSGLFSSSARRVSAECSCGV